MARSRRLFAAVMGLILSISLSSGTSMTVEAGSNVNYLDSLSGGVAAMLSYGNENAEKLITTTEKELSQNASEDAEESTLVMANVKNALNVRAEASGNSKKVGKLYKDCGGEILEQKRLMDGAGVIDLADGLELKHGCAPSSSWPGLPQGSAGTARR